MTFWNPVNLRVQHIEVALSGASQRLDNYLLRLLKGVPRSHIYRLIRDGQVRVNGSRSRVHRKLVDGDIVRIPPIRTTAKEASVSTKELTSLVNCTLYEDDSLLIINKPSGVAVHGGSGLRGGVIETLRNSTFPKSYLELVHRLDRQTSGCLLLAKDPITLRNLHQTLRIPNSKKLQKSI